MNVPLQVLSEAALRELGPMVSTLCARGWDARAWIEEREGRVLVELRIRLPEMALPVEAEGQPQGQNGGPQWPAADGEPTPEPLPPDVCADCRGEGELGGVECLACAGRGRLVA